MGVPGGNKGLKKKIRNVPVQEFVLYDQWRSREFLIAYGYEKCLEKYVKGSRRTTP